MLLYSGLSVSLFLLSFSWPIEAISNTRFPADFQFGVATASYQVEGGWNEDGKGENTWDYFVHQDPSRIDNFTNGDIACDSYHKWEDDIALIKNLGASFYRFSLSWSRILPTGQINNVNQAGVDYYKKLIKGLRSNNIDIMITLFHWDLPQPLQDLGGWTNEYIVESFASYAKLAFTLFGDDVKYWASFNEPKTFCGNGYDGGAFAPGVKSEGIGEYLCAYNVLKSHARAYHIYNDTFKATQKGKFSIVLNTDWHEPATNSSQDIEAAERMIQFVFGLYSNAIFSEHGNYPQVMIDRVADRSKKEGFASSRLIELTQEEIYYIRGTFDFLGLNTYTTTLCKWQDDEPIGSPNVYKDISVNAFKDPSWPSSASSWLKVVPWGMKKLLAWIKKTYGDTEIIITENGTSDLGGIHDQARIDYIQGYLDNVLMAMNEDGVNVVGYTAWSLMDNFEWLRGYTEKFGLHQVDFNNSSRPRTIKDSGNYYKYVIESKCLVVTCV